MGVLSAGLRGSERSMTMRLIDAQNRCFGLRCDERETCERYRQVARDAVAVVDGSPRRYCQSLRSDTGPCPRRIVEVQG